MTFTGRVAFAARYAAAGGAPSATDGCLGDRIVL
jgi:hypothetical protein